MNGNNESGIGLFWRSVIAVVLVYVILKFGFPYISMFVAGSDRPLPIPNVAFLMFIILTLIGVLVYATANEGKMQEFLSPIITVLRGEEGMYRILRIVVLVLFPLLVGWVVYSESVPKVASPTGLRIQHPTIPGKYEKLQNPFRNPDDETVKKFIEEEGLQNVSLEEARAMLVDKYTAEGRDLFQKNCRPCHGSAADGNGPMREGFRLKPIAFTDPGTIATVVEGYVFWRITEGWTGLPPQATPWDSAMPIWGPDLTEEEIWKIILGEYNTAGVEPRKPEKLE